jgi:hypothetical protein
VDGRKAASGRLFFWRWRTLQRGRPAKTESKNVQICTLKIDAAAEEAGIGRQTVRHARQVTQRGTPELVKAVESGRIAVSAAASFGDCSVSTTNSTPSILLTLCLLGACCLLAADPKPS